MLFVESDKLGSIPNGKLVFVVDRSLKTLIQVSLVIVDELNGEMFVGVVLAVTGELIAVLLFVLLEEVMRSIAFSRKRVNAPFDERRNAINNLVERIIVRG